MKWIVMSLLLAGIFALSFFVFQVATTPIGNGAKDMAQSKDTARPVSASSRCPDQYSKESSEILTAVTIYGDQSDSEHDRSQMAKLATWAQQQSDPCVRKLYAMWIGVHNDNRDEMDRQMNKYTADKSAVASGAVPTPDDYPGKLPLNQSFPLNTNPGIMEICTDPVSKICTITRGTSP